MILRAVNSCVNNFGSLTAAGVFRVHVVALVGSLSRRSFLLKFDTGGWKHVVSAGFVLARLSECCGRGVCSNTEEPFRLYAHQSAARGFLALQGQGVKHLNCVEIPAK